MLMTQETGLRGGRLLEM